MEEVTTKQTQSAQVTGPGSWYAQLAATAQAAHDPQVSIPAATYSFMEDKGNAILYDLDEQEQLVSMEQAQGLLQSLQDTEAWAIEEGAAGTAMNYLLTNMQTQLQLGQQWLAAQK